MTNGPNKIPGPGSARNMIYIDTEDWLQTFCYSKCTDPRDKIFGFYGCFRSDLRSRINIDYSKEPAEVFRSFTQAVIESGNLYVICRTSCFDNRAKSHQNAPSWVPNFAAPKPHGKDMTLFSTSRKFSASGDLMTFYRFFNEGTVLLVRGVCIGTTQLVSPIFQLQPQPVRTASDLIPIMEHLAQCCKTLNVLQQYDGLAAFADSLMPFGGSAVLPALLRATNLKADYPTAGIPISNSKNLNFLLESMQRIHVARAMFSFMPVEIEKTRDQARHTGGYFGIWHRRNGDWR